jgi:hypothetical protein
MTTHFTDYPTANPTYFSLSYSCLRGPRHQVWEEEFMIQNIRYMHTDAKIRRTKRKKVLPIVCQNINFYAEEDR